LKLSRVKTYDSTGLATAGRLYAGDLNQIQDQYADLYNLVQTLGVGSLSIGEGGLQIVRYGPAEARLSGALRTDGILRGLGGLYAGAFTTAQRDAISPTALRPYGLIILNTTSNRLEINLGTEAAPAWMGLGAVINRGALGARPAPSPGNQNTLYFATDDQGGTLYYSDGTAWTKIARGLTEPISAAMIPANSIDDTKVAVGALSPNRINGTAVISSDGRLSDQRVPTDNSVSTQKLQDASVTNAKIASGIDAAKITGLQTGLQFQKIALAADISMDGAGTVYDAVQLSLPAGTWLIHGYIAVFSGTATSVTARLWDGATVYRTGSTEVGINTSLDTIPVSDILVLTGTTTVRLAAATDHSGVASIKAKDMGNIGVITYMNAVKIA